MNRDLIARATAMAARLRGIDQSDDHDVFTNAPDFAEVAAVLTECTAALTEAGEDVAIERLRLGPINPPPSGSTPPRL